MPAGVDAADLIPPCRTTPAALHAGVHPLCAAAREAIL
jgi:hypothetical protein